MLVATKLSDDSSVHTIEKTGIGRRTFGLASRVAGSEKYLHHTPNSVLHSTARMPTLALRRVKQIGPDVVLLHWLGSRTMSISQIGRLLGGCRPVAWRLADTWAFCGAEHYPRDVFDTRFADGYQPMTRHGEERGLDVNRRTWARKQKHWTQSASLIAPSHWIADQARQSALMRTWPVHVVPTPMDTEWWGGLSRSDARQRLGLPRDARIVLFCVDRPVPDPRKGLDLLESALARLRERVPASDDSLVVLAFGDPVGARRLNVASLRSLGRLDDEGLRLYYTAADVVVVPSRQDNLPQTAIEPIACGTPVVAFNVGGLSDIIEDSVNGRLASAFSIEELSDAILWTISDEGRRGQLSGNARKSAERWSRASIGARYATLLGSLLEESNRMKDP